MTLGLFLLRAYQNGLTIEDLDSMETGTVIDIITESANDNETYRPLATQADFDRF